MAENSLLSGCKQKKTDKKCLWNLFQVSFLSVQQKCQQQKNIRDRALLQTVDWNCKDFHRLVWKLLECIIVKKFNFEIFCICKLEQIRSSYSRLFNPTLKGAAVAHKWQWANQPPYQKNNRTGLWALTNYDKKIALLLINSSVNPAKKFG